MCDYELIRYYTNCEKLKFTLHDYLKLIIIIIINSYELIGQLSKDGGCSGGLLPPKKNRELFCDSRGTDNLN